MAKLVELVGGPALFREALASGLAGAGYDVSLVGESVSPPDAAIVFVAGEREWEQLSDMAMWLPAVAVLPDLQIELFVRALAAGAGAVHVDNASHVVVDVLAAAIDGEARLPLSVTQALALHVPPSSREVRALALNAFEAQVADAVREGLSVAEIAAKLHFSERTVRRRLQGVYLKIGAANRADAVRILIELGPGDSG